MKFPAESGLINAEIRELTQQRVRNMISFFRCSMLGLWSAYFNKIKMKTTEVFSKRIEEKIREVK